jgi:hypothetical protein
MTTLPLATGARLLGIHPKTLHHWLKEAHFPLAAHPSDARIKCVAQQHLLEVAKHHGRPPPDLAAAARRTGGAAPASSEEQAKLLPTNETEADPAAASRSTTSPAEAELMQKLCGLEAKVGLLQEQLAQLALTLLQERERAVEYRLQALETLTAELVRRPGFPASLPEAQATVTSPTPACAPTSPRQLNPAEQRARSRMPPLIEYAADGSYVIVSSQEGELHLCPDSPQWFDWLATLSSFRFVGQSGRFTAYRDSDQHGPTRSWRAHRSIHQHRYQHCLGVTDRLTIACLEQMAAKFQAYVDAL